MSDVADFLGHPPLNWISKIYWLRIETQDENNLDLKQAVSGKRKRILLSSFK